MLSEIRCGPSPCSDATVQPARGTRDGCLVVAQGAGSLQELGIRGPIFSLSNSAAYTIVGGNAPGQALATAVWANGFVNPANSGKNVVLLRTLVYNTSGTPGGALTYQTCPKIQLSSTPTGTIRSNIVTNQTSGAGTVCIPYVGVILAVLPADTSSATVFHSLVGGAAAAAIAGQNSYVDEVNGRIVIPPGTAFGIGSTATGTSHVVQTQMDWIEVPV